MIEHICTKFQESNLTALLFQFVLTAAGTQAEQVIDELKPTHEGKLQRIPVFFVAKRLT
jgi:etoposide-induced 2.4 mRNA